MCLSKPGGVPPFVDGLTGGGGRGEEGEGTPSFSTEGVPILPDEGHPVLPDGGYTHKYWDTHNKTLNFSTTLKNEIQKPVAVSRWLLKIVTVNSRFTVFHLIT